MNTNTVTIGYLPLAVVALFLAAAMILIDLPTMNQTVIVQPTPTPVIIMVATPAAAQSVAQQLASLQNNVSGSFRLPTLDDVRAAVAQPAYAAEEVSAQPANTQQVAWATRPDPAGNQVNYQVAGAQEWGGDTWVGAPTGWYRCGDLSLSGRAPATNAAGWQQSPGWMQAHLIDICNMTQVGGLAQ